MIQYNYWGSGINEPPAHLKTKKQLSELGLSPKQPIAYIETSKYTLYLYDPNNPESVKPKRKASEFQLSSLAKGRLNQKYQSWYSLVGWLYDDCNHAIHWAKEVLTNKENYVILDTETTGLDSDSEVVQIAIISLDGETILDSLVKPTIPIPKESTEIHGITDNDVIDAPTFPEIYPSIANALKDKKVLIYNAAFDTRILKYCCKLHNLKLLGLSKRSDCVMEWYAQYYGEWSNYYNDYKLQPLNSNHNALGDCLATKKLIEKMANDEIVEVYQQFLNSLKTSSQ